jgi:hypothetical protein
MTSQPKAASSLKAVLPGYPLDSAAGSCGYFIAGVPRFSPYPDGCAIILGRGRLILGISSIDNLGVDQSGADELGSVHACH